MITSQLENYKSHVNTNINTNDYFVEEYLESIFFNWEEYQQQETDIEMEDFFYFYKKKSYTLDITDETYIYIYLKVQMDLLDCYEKENIYLDIQELLEEDDSLDSISEFQFKKENDSLYEIQESRNNNRNNHIENDKNVDVEKDKNNDIENNIKEDNEQDDWFDNEYDIDNFDWYKYINTYVDLKKDGIHSKQKAWNHWINYGRFEDRICFKIKKGVSQYTNNKMNFENNYFDNEIDPTFDWVSYIKNNVDLKKDGLNSKQKAWDHWINHGKIEGRNYNCIYDNAFDWSYYIQNNSDLMEDGINTKDKAWLHWTNYGKYENRPHLFIQNKSVTTQNKSVTTQNNVLKNDTETYDNFQWETYINNYEDLKNMTNKKKAWDHWLRFGKVEGRTTENMDQKEINKYNLNGELVNYNNILFKEKYINYGLHYYGWQNVINTFIENYKNNTEIRSYKYNIFFDEWIEKLLLWGNKILNKKYLESIKKNKYKMISFIHCPPFLKWHNTLDKQELQKNIIIDDKQLNNHLFDKIKEEDLNNNIIFLYTLSNYHKEYIYKNYPNFKDKIVSVSHPIEINNKKLFNINKFLKNKKIYHIGWWLRNFKTFIDCTLPQHFRKVILIKNDFIAQWNNTISKNNNITNIEIVHELSNKEYASIFQKSCIFIDVVDCTANNTILECISFNTPIIIRRSPSAEEYLGKEYPLFFNNVNDLECLNQEVFLLNLIVDSYKYLQNLNKNHISMETFNNKINYDLSKLSINNSNIQLSWCCLLTFENIFYLDNFINFFVKQNSNNIYLYLYIQYDLNQIIYDIEDMMNMHNNIEYIFLDKSDNIYLEFYNQCIQHVNTELLTIVNVTDEFNVDFSSLFIDYLNKHPNCDIAFSSFQYINGKNKNAVSKHFEKDLLLFESNFYNLELPTSGFVWRKKIHEYIFDLDNTDYHIQNNFLYFLKKCMISHLNIMCISEEPTYSILC
jgi:hypothetical protein